ncbi:MAG: DUF4112 domain-containing protein [Acidobacteria bacterium]|nr:DUF4112 domain-containing protein [Acidobacteriota bacterium]
MLDRFPTSGERLDLIRRWAHLLDDRFRIPGTRIRFGLDPVLGLIPGLGDLITPVFNALLLVQGFTMRIPKIVQLRMLLNVALDAALGALPVVGDLFDLSWKANVRNLALIERHAGTGQPATRGDWLFVLTILGGIAFLMILPIVMAMCALLVITDKGLW